MKKLAKAASSISLVTLLTVSTTLANGIIITRQDSVIAQAIDAIYSLIGIIIT